MDAQCSRSLSSCGVLQQAAEEEEGDVINEMYELHTWCFVQMEDRAGRFTASLFFLHTKVNELHINNELYLNQRLGYSGRHSVAFQRTLIVFSRHIVFHSFIHGVNIIPAEAIHSLFRIDIVCICSDIGNKHFSIYTKRLLFHVTLRKNASCHFICVEKLFPNHFIT